MSPSILEDASVANPVLDPADDFTSCLSYFDKYFAIHKRPLSCSADVVTQSAPQDPLSTGDWDAVFSQYCASSSNEFSLQTGSDVIPEQFDIISHGNMNASSSSWLDIKPSASYDVFSLQSEQQDFYTNADLSMNEYSDALLWNSSYWVETSSSYSSGNLNEVLSSTPSVSSPASSCNSFSQSCYSESCVSDEIPSPLDSPVSDLSSPVQPLPFCGDAACPLCDLTQGSHNDGDSPKTDNRRDHSSYPPRYSPYARPSSKRSPKRPSSKTSKKPSSSKRSKKRSSSKRSSKSTSKPTSPKPVLDSLSASSGSSCSKLSKPRNEQIEISETDFFHALLFPHLGCPACGYVSPRIADLRRHMQTHQPSEEWICCGLPAKWVLPEGVQPESVAGTYLYKNVLMIGGCMKELSRRDSFVRHLQNGICRGDADVVNAINQGCGALLNSEGVQPAFGPL